MIIIIIDNILRNDSITYHINKFYICKTNIVQDMLRF